MAVIGINEAKKQRRVKRIGFVLAGLVLSCGILPAGSNKLKSVKSFVPPALPAPVVEAAVIEGLEFDQSLFSKELPVLLSMAAPAAASRAIEGEIRLRRAEEHFKKGRDLAAKGQMPAARISFDNALEELAGASPTMPERARLMARYQTLVDEIFGLETQQHSQQQPKAESAAAPEQQQPEGETPGFDRAPVEQIAETTFAIEPSLKGKVLDQVRSTVSQLRLEVEDPVVGFINFFTTPRGREIVAAGIRRAGRYAPMIRRILDEEGLPPEMIYLAQAESGFMPRAVSWASAVGMWQFIQSRGREYGLTQTAHTDDRLDPEKATRAAARHLRDLYHQFGDWYLAVAAYNCGPYAVERGVQRTGYADFWELYKKNVLPRETANYLPIILALTIMAKNPKAYGLDGITPDAPMQYDTIRLTAETHLELVADLAGMPVARIQELNPAVLRLIAPAGYEIHVPKGQGKVLLSRLEFVPEAKRSSWRVRRFLANDTVATVAAQFRLSEQALAIANRQPYGGDSTSGWSPEEGDFVVIPAAYPGAAADPRLVSRKRTVSRGRRVVTANRGRVSRPVVRPAASSSSPVKRGAKPAAASPARPTLARR